MKSYLRQIFALVPALLFSIFMPAQSVSTLPSDPSITTGTLPNGMDYYLVSNKSAKGHASFALVQKTGYGTVPGESDRPLAAAKGALASDSKTGSVSVQNFMTRHGAAPSADGFVRVTDDATIFRFNDLDVVSDKTALDSVLMVIMDMSDRCNRTDDGFVGKWYVPSDQAVMVSGDIDTKSVAEKLRLMSLMVTAGESQTRPEYVWEDVPKARFAVEGDSKDGLSEIAAIWSSRRAPREYMNTVQQEVFTMMMNVLGDISCERLETLLSDRYIPHTGVRYELQDGTDCSADNSLALKLIVPQEFAEEALKALAEVTSALDSDGVSSGELRLSMSRCRQPLGEESRRSMKSNDGYIDRCISAYLYNASLATAKERFAYHTSRRIADSTGVRLFNGISSALLDKDRNLLVKVTGMADSLRARALFDSVWTASAARGVISSTAPNLNDTMSFTGPVPKVKLKSVKNDYVSGGSVWTFSNGFKVVYRNMPSARRVSYMLALNGGYGSIADLSAGEGAYMSDFLDLFYISGIKGKDFQDILMTEGITMDAQVHLSNLMISGTAPDNRIPLLMKGLLAVANDRRPDMGAFEEYVENEELSLKTSRLSPVSRMTAVDSIMCPGYRYSDYKSSGKLTDGFMDRTADYLENQMKKMNDGVLIIVGDIKEEQLKKTLLEYVGGFRTEDTAFRRTFVRYQPISGWSTYTVNGDVNSIDVIMSARMPITADNYMAAAVAVMLLRQRLIEALDGTGLHLSVSHVCKLYPEDRLNVRISVTEADVDGFASGVGHKKPLDAMGIIRHTLSTMSSSDIDAARLASFKAYIKNEMAVEMADPDYWVTAIALRHLDGKDLTTGYSAKADAVTADKVKALLASLEAGSKVEYVTTKDQ